MRISGVETAALPASIVTYISGLERTSVIQKNEITTLKNKSVILKNENVILQNEIILLKERLDILLYKRFAHSAERLSEDARQRLLFDEGTTAEPGTAGEVEATGTEKIKSYSRKKVGRKPLDPAIPRRITVVDISESEKQCACGAKLTQIGEEIAEKLVIIPPEIYVERTVRPKYACRACEGTEDESKPTVRIAPVPPAIIPRSIASESLLAYVMIQKYQDHLPFYRQESQFARIGVEISRQDMVNWQQQIYAKLQPLFELMKETVSGGPVIQMDETTVQVMSEPGRKDTQKSYMWLARGGPPGKKVVWYEYHPTRNGAHAKALLEKFSGYLQTDGFEGYNKAIAGRTDIIHVGCFAHARRKFFEATKVTKTPRSAEEGIKYIRKLYQIEEELRGQNLEGEQFVLERKRRAEPALAAFKAWLDKRVVDVLPSSALGKAIGYTLNQWRKLTAYLESPHLTPDNNACENAIRPFVVGRKNWLFNQSPKGAESSCGMFSLIETAKQNDLEPIAYLRALFERCPLAASPDDWQKLLPWNIITA